MGEIASHGQLRASFLRWAAVTVPAVLLLGIGSGQLAGSGDGNRWFDALEKPATMPPGWAFGAAWTLLYILMGLALAMVLHARGARARGYAIALFGFQLALNLAWAPLFFAAHKMTAAFALILAILLFALAATLAFGRIRAAAAWLMVPYLAWLCFAAILNWQIHRLNPNADRLVPATPRTQILL